MKNEENKTKPKLGVAPYVIAWLGILLPYIGIIFSLVATVWGIISQKKGSRSLIILGFVGISLFAILTIFPFYSLFSLFNNANITTQTNYYTIQNSYQPQSSNLIIVEDNLSQANQDKRF